MLVTRAAKAKGSEGSPLLLWSALADTLSDTGS